jgi:hypothetical protein
VVDADGVTDFATNATAVQDVLDDENLPQPGDVLNEESHPNLFVVSRDIVMESPKRGTVTVNYQYFNRVLNYVHRPGLYTGKKMKLVVRPISEAKQITTQKDRKGTPIEVSHRPAAGANLMTEIGDISVLSISDGFGIDVVINTDEPDVKVLQWMNTVNESSWLGGDAEEWLCAGATWFWLKAASPGKAVMSFEFRYDGLGWQPDVFWRPQGGESPPKGLVEGEGRLTVDWYIKKDFNIEP